MNENLKLMCVFAHPDDETLGTGSTLAKYAAEGVEIYVLTATRGERGWAGDQNYSGQDHLCAHRVSKLYYKVETDLFSGLR